MVRSARLRFGEKNFPMEETNPSTTAQKFNQNAERHSKDKQFFPSRAGPPAENGKVRINTKFKPYKKTTTMKTMKDFAAQQLSKKQMNEVMGGQQMITEDLLLC